MSRHSDGGPAPRHDALPPSRRLPRVRPTPDLADAVEALWTHEAAGVQVAVHRVVPDAAVSLCFMGPRAPDGTSGAARLRVIGPVTTPHLFAPPIGHRMQALRVKLEWCRPLLGVAPWEHANAAPLYARTWSSRWKHASWRATPPPTRSGSDLRAPAKPIQGA